MLIAVMLALASAYIAGGGSGTLSATTYVLLFSSSSDRSNAQPLQGQSVYGNTYIFTSPSDGVSTVSFYIDDPDALGTPYRVEKTAPYDLNGGTVSTASPYNTTLLADGQHSVTALIKLSNGSTQKITATFNVINSAPQLQFDRSAVVWSVGSGGTATQQVALTGGNPPASYTLSYDASWLSLQPTTGTTPANITLAANTQGLQPGIYTSTVLATAPNYKPASLRVTITVGEQIHLSWTGDPSRTLTIVWRTFDTSIPSLVQYRQAGTTTWQQASGSLRASGTRGTLHEVTLSSLTPSTSYEYRVMLDGSTWSETYTTHTAPPKGPADLDVIYVADTGLIGREDGLASGTQQVIDEIARMHPNLVLLGGDYAYYSTDKRFGSLDNSIDAWFNQMQRIGAKIPVMPTYGNHETLLGEGYSYWAARFATPNGYSNRQNYSFDIGDIHFVSIYAVENSKGLSDGQLQWIEQDILAAKAAGQRWIVPFYHVSPFADGRNHPSNLALRAQLGPLFERLGVKIAVSSHDQAYERTYPLVDVPNSNTPTSTAKDCYTMSDGVTWVKSSPGGKASNKNGSFSQFGTNPPPSWTAYRDNTMHHFLRIRFSADGTMRVEGYGVRGDGSPPVLQDSFMYTTGSCGSAGPETTITAGPTGLTNQTSATFQFTSSENNSTFLCSLDGSPFSPCSSPVAYSGLQDGNHTFQVKAVDQAGNQDPSPASRAWTIDTTPPAITGTTPVNGANEVPTNTKVSVALSERADPASINGSTFYLTKSGSSLPVPAQVSYDDALKIAALQPDAPLEAGSTYTARATGDIRDLAGNGLGADYSWAFTVSSNPSAGGLLGEYFNNSDLTDLVLTRVDPVVDFNWDYGSPDPSIDPDTYSVRWTGMVKADRSETYTFYTRSNDGVRLWVNGKLLVNNWTNHAETENKGSISLTAGTWYQIRLEYYEGTGRSIIRLLYSSPSTPKQIIPSDHLRTP